MGTFLAVEIRVPQRAILIGMEKMLFHHILRAAHRSK
jgi:hypothetical protein